MTLPAILGAPTALPPTRRRPVPGAGVAAEAPSLAAFPNPLPLRVEKQGGENWCWAAVTIGIARLYGAPVESRQCRFVTQTFSMAPADRCCTVPPSQECDLPSSLDAALYAVNCYADGANTVEFGTIRGEISGGRVVGVRIRRPNGSGHFMAISGWRLAAGGEEWIIVNDPAEGTVKDMLLNDLVHSREGDWTNTTITRRPGAGLSDEAPSGRAPNGPLGG